MTAGGSIMAMSYYGGEKVIPGYNIMGIAKAALESAIRYLAISSLISLKVLSFSAPFMAPALK